MSTLVSCPTQCFVHTALSHHSICYQTESFMFQGSLSNKSHPRLIILFIDVETPPQFSLALLWSSTPARLLLLPVDLCICVCLKRGLKAQSWKAHPAAPLAGMAEANPTKAALGTGSPGHQLQSIAPLPHVCSYCHNCKMRVFSLNHHCWAHCCRYRANSENESPVFGILSR